MPKRLKQQRRGKGSSVYRAPSHRFIGKVKYTITGKAVGKVVDIIHDPARDAPVAVVKFPQRKELLLAPEGLKTGDAIEYDGEPRKGNVLPLGKIPEGTQIFNIELRPNDGGKLCRSSGTFATVIGHEKGKTTIMLPSRVIKKLSDKCRATIGIVAGSGRGLKPFLKAGNKFYLMRTRGKYYPIVSGVAMNPVDHPFGGRTKPGKPKTVSRNTPPGAKVGSIAARRTGKRKK